MTAQPVHSSCLLIAEVGQAHDGSLGTAHAYISAVARAGADGIKFQTHIAAAESHPSEPWRVKFSLQDESRFDYWRRMEFTESQWKGLKDHSSELGLLFVSSPFSSEAVELLARVGIDMWKIASGEVSNHQLIEKILLDKRPVILSSGMSSIGELDETIELIKGHGADLTLLQCTSAYPCPPEKVGLNMIELFRQRYAVPVGLSDHSGTIFAGLAAAALGISLLEVHVTLSRDSFGPDVPASITLDELAELKRGVTFIETALGNAIDKEQMSGALAPLRILFTRSLVLARDVEEGQILTDDDLVLKKPGSGLPPSMLRTMSGRRAARRLTANSILKEEDVS